MDKQQRGGTILGFILGLIVGLGVALGVAVYVTKVPVPFLNKGESRNTPAADTDRFTCARSKRCPMASARTSA